MSQMEEHNSTHALLNAQMKNLNVSLMNGSTCRLKKLCRDVKVTLKSHSYYFVFLNFHFP